MFEESAGIIPIHKESKDILLVHQTAGHWGFPKGHLEGKETPQQAALRELFEETHIKDVLLKGNPIVKEYSFEKAGITIAKKVSYFIGIVNTKEVSIQKAELQGFAWLPYSEALKQLTFSKEVLEGINLFDF